MARVKYFIRTTKKATNSEVNVRVRFYHGRLFDVTANTPWQIMPEYWNHLKGCVRQRADFSQSDNFQNDLDDLEGLIKREYNNTPDKNKIDKGWLGKAIDKFYNPQKYPQTDTLFGYIQQFINNSAKRINLKTGDPVSYKMRREYEVTFRYLQEYAKKSRNEPDFIDMDIEFYQLFVEFLRKKGLATNTMGKKITVLKIFLNAAFEDGINKYQKYKSRNFIALTEESDNIYLTKEELQQLYEYDFTNNLRLERVRDLFIIGCWTGLRYSDLQQITNDKIKGDFIELKQKKTNKKVVIPIHPTVREILKKYDGVLPKPISNQKYNDYLKEAAKLSGINETFIKTASHKGMRHEKKYPKYDLISSHASRRSFCTNAYKDNIPTLAIMAISGHKTEQAFLKYIKADGKEHAEKVLKAWQESGDFVRIAK